MPSLSAILCARSGCERPENSISRFEGPRSIQCSGLTSGLDSATSSPGRRVSSLVVVMLSTEIALFRDLPRRESGQRFGRDIFCYVRASCNPCVVPDLDRRLEAILDSGPDVAADLRPLFGTARRVREVAGDVSGRDVRAFPDLGVADIGQMGNLRPCAELGVLELDEGSGLRAATKDRAGTEVAEGADRDVLADVRVDRDDMRSDLGARSNPCAPAQDREGMNRGVG